jgi:hypothetical protein
MVSIDRFFETVHTVKPFLDKPTFLSRYDAVLHNGLGVNNESAVVLAVLALGAIGGTPGGNGQVFHEDTPGMGYLTSALHILTSSWMTSFTGDIVLSQGLVICALYFCCLVQPLPAWKLIHMASTNLQQLLIRCAPLRGLESTDHSDGWQIEEHGIRSCRHRRNHPNKLVLFSDRMV